MVRSFGTKSVKGIRRKTRSIVAFLMRVAYDALCNGIAKWKKCGSDVGVGNVGSWAYEV